MQHLCLPMEDEGAQAETSQKTFLLRVSDGSPHELIAQVVLYMAARFTRHEKQQERKRQAEEEERQRQREEAMEAKK